MGKLSQRRHNCRGPHKSRYQPWVLKGSILQLSTVPRLALAPRQAAVSPSLERQGRLFATQPKSPLSGALLMAFGGTSLPCTQPPRSGHAAVNHSSSLCKNQIRSRPDTEERALGPADSNVDALAVGAGTIFTICLTGIAIPPIGEDVPTLMEVDVAVPRLMPAIW